ncbi:MAG TPA: DNA-formamidopyrimidine glycosylase [Patescibacteria group bacterium]|nr:DNA-formamidopyrimidine glycosylase [Patescibacteria group bacterium]
MPELPEVETIRLQLDQRLKGLKITEVEVLNKKSFIGPPSHKASEGEEVIGKKVIGVKRRAKIALIELEGGLYLAIHLKLTGQLIYSSHGGGIKGCAEKEESPFKVCELPNKFTRVIISFDNGGRLFFNDLRIFGWVKVIRDLGEVGGGKLGPEANDEKAFTFEYFQSILSKTKKPVKLVILDQEKLAGVGNIYVNEALFKAGIMPTRPANSLGDKDIKLLRDSIIWVLTEAIKRKGTSDRDEAYRQISGEKGDYQNHLQVYGKTGKPCPKCDGKVERVNLGGRGTFFCRKCQT